MGHKTFHQHGDESEKWKYCKPRHGDATQHLMVAGPLECILKLYDIVKEREDDCDYVSEMVGTPSPHFFLSCETVEQAVEMRERMQEIFHNDVLPEYINLHNELQNVHVRPDVEDIGEKVQHMGENHAKGAEEHQECDAHGTEKESEVVEDRKKEKIHKRKKQRKPRIAVHFAEIEYESRTPQQGPVPAVMTAEACEVPGLMLLTDFISPSEEEKLLQFFDSQKWERLARRRVQHYGIRFSYLTRSVDLDGPVPQIPENLANVTQKVEECIPVDCRQKIDQITVNEYPLGVGLSPHVDTHSAFGNFIISLSLGSGVTMVFRRNNTQKALYLPPRSLVIMTGESRWAWEHYIPHRKSDVLESGDIIARGARRVSLTLRAVRRVPCTCPFPETCDDQDGNIPPTRMAATSTKSDAHGIEEGNVHKVYDAIASHFSATRFAIWPRVREFIESIPPYSTVADVGCGNGKYFGVRKDLFVAGSDISSGLAKVAAKRLQASRTLMGSLKGTNSCPKADVVIADGLHLPYIASSCTAVLSIAVIHHMSSVERRIDLLEEIGRILRVGGRAIITAWATEQQDMKKLSKWRSIGPPVDNSLNREYSSKNDYLVPWHLPLHRAEASSVLQEAGEIDNQKNTIVFNRYYHLFEPGEMEGLVTLCHSVHLVDSFYDRDNWCIIVERTAT